MSIRRTIKSSKRIANKLIKHQYLEIVGRLVNINTENTLLANTYLNSMQQGGGNQATAKVEFIR